MSSDTATLFVFVIVLFYVQFFVTQWLLNLLEDRVDRYAKYRDESTRTTLEWKVEASEKNLLWRIEALEREVKSLRTDLDKERNRSGLQRAG